MAQCTARSKQSGERCKRHASPGRTVCYIHGGKSLRGTDLPQFKHGRYSKYLPDRLAEKYAEALSDKDLVTLEDDIALVEARLKTELQNLRDHGMGMRGWQRARGLYLTFQAQTNAGRQEQAIRTLGNLGRLLSQGTEGTAAWETIENLIEQRRKLIETERKRYADEDRAITIDRLMILMAAVIDIVRRNVESPEARRAISDEIRRLVDSNPRPS
jgi:hypothetical protein